MASHVRPLLRPATPPPLFSSAASTTYICQPCRHARLLRRPKRPYTFTQLVTLSDGSAFTMRTTSPLPVYRSTRDTRNSPLWNPNSKELLNVEDDEAGRLAGFRARFGRGFDVGKEGTSIATEATDGESSAAKSSESKEPEVDEYGFGAEEEDANLLDLISSFGEGSRVKKDKKPSSKAK